MSSYKHKCGGSLPGWFASCVFCRRQSSCRRSGSLLLSLGFYMGTGANGPQLSSFLGKLLSWIQSIVRSPLSRGKKNASLFFPDARTSAIRFNCVERASASLLANSWFLHCFLVCCFLLPSGFWPGFFYDFLALFLCLHCSTEANSCLEAVYKRR